MKADPYSEEYWNPTIKTWRLWMKCHPVDKLKPIHYDFGMEHKRAAQIPTTTTPSLCKLRDISYQVEIKVDIYFEQV